MNIQKVKLLRQRIFAPPFSLHPGHFFQKRGPLTAPLTISLIWSGYIHIEKLIFSIFRTYFLIFSNI